MQEIIDSAKIVKEPEIPFPQADSFDRVINLCELLKEKDFLSKEEITQNYDFDKRQTDYYINAGKYLGLAQTCRDRINSQNVCFLSVKGKLVFNMSLIERQKEFVKLIISHAAFKQTLMLYLENGETPTKNDIVEIMKRSKLYNVESNETYIRRASTIIGWTNWIVDQIEE